MEPAAVLPIFILGLEVKDCVSWPSRSISAMLIDGAPLDAPAAPLQELLAVGLGEAPDDLALVSAERGISWDGLEAASVTLAGAYRWLGLEPG